MSTVTLTIPTGASRDHHLILLNELESHVLARPAALDLRIGGEPAMAASTAAAYCALIVRFLSCGGDVVTSAVTALTGAAAILWLHGSIRRVNPGCYIVFSSPPPESRIETVLSHVGGPPDSRSQITNPEWECYSRLLWRSERFLHVPEVLDMTLFEDRLRELLLIGPVDPIPSAKQSPSSNLRALRHGLWDPEPPASQLQT